MYVSLRVTFFKAQPTTTQDQFLDSVESGLSYLDVLQGAFSCSPCMSNYSRPRKNGKPKDLYWGLVLVKSGKVRADYVHALFHAVAEAFPALIPDVRTYVEFDGFDSYEKAIEYHKDSNHSIPPHIIGMFS